MWLLSQEASNLGTLLGGAAAAVGVVVLLIAGPIELRRWRTRKRDEVRADAATEALLAAHGILDAVESLAQEFMLDAFPQRQGEFDRWAEEWVQTGTRWLQQRVRDTATKLSELQRATSLAQVRLGDEYAALLGRAKNLYYEAILRAQAFASTGPARSGMMGNPLEGLIESTDELRDAIAANLAPLARYEAGPVLGHIVARLRDGD